MSALSIKRIAVVGSGAAARALVRALPAHADLSLHGVVDRDARAASALAGGARSFASVDRMLATSRAPEIAAIFAPPSLHLELARPLLCAGTDLLLQAPLATTPGDAERITELAERLGRSLVCRSPLASHSRPPLPPELAPERLTRVEISLATRRDARAGWRAEPTLSGGGVLMDLGPAALELAEQLAGPLAQVRMRSIDRLQGAEVEDSVHLEAAHQTGVLSSIHLSWNEPQPPVLARCSGAHADHLIPPGDASEGWRALLGELLGRRLARDAICDEGARALGWLHAAYRSLELGRWQYA